MMDDLSQAHLDHLDAEREPPNTCLLYTSDAADE